VIRYIIVIKIRVLINRILFNILQEITKITVLKMIKIQIIDFYKTNNPKSLKVFTGFEYQNNSKSSK
jgi:hypothetical protein